MSLEQQQLLLDKLADDKNFAMFSAAGNNRVQALVKKCIKKIFGKSMRQSEYEAYVSAEAKKVRSQEKYSEMGDTAVRECIYHYLEMAIDMADYDWGRDFEYYPY